MLELVELSLTKDITEDLVKFISTTTNVYYIIIQCTSEDKSPEINFVRCFTSETVLGEHRVDKTNIPAYVITCSRLSDGKYPSSASRVLAAKLIS